MKSIIFALAMALTSLSAAAENNFSFMINTTAGQILPVGKYYWIHVENGVPVITEIITKPITSNPDDPDDPDEPVPGDIEKQVASLLAKVTADTDKKTTASKLSGLCDLLLAQVEAGTIKDVAVLRKDINAVVPVLTLMGKAPAWKPFTDGVSALIEKADFQTCITVLKAVTAALKQV